MTLSLAWTKEFLLAFHETMSMPFCIHVFIANSKYNHEIINYKELKKKDKNWKTKKIRARFICALSICYLNKKIACVVGKVEGNISPKPRGNNGFGYDPIFIPLNKKLTFGEMKLKTKYKIDHRYKAYKKIKKFF